MPPAVAHPDVARAVAFIAEHSAEGISVDDVVADNRLSAIGLKVAFRTHLERTIYDEIQRVRCARVRELLV